MESFSKKLLRILKKATFPRHVRGKVWRGSSATISAHRARLAGAGRGASAVRGLAVPGVRGTIAAVIRTGLCGAVAAEALATPHLCFARNGCHREDEGSRQHRYESFHRQPPVANPHKRKDRVAALFVPRKSYFVNQWVGISGPRSNHRSLLGRDVSWRHAYLCRGFPGEWT